MLKYLAVVALLLHGVFASPWLPESDLTKHPALLSKRGASVAEGHLRQQTRVGQPGAAAVALGLAVTLVVTGVCIVLLLFRLRDNNAALKKLNDRVRGLQHDSIKTRSMEIDDADLKAQLKGTLAKEKQRLLDEEARLRREKEEARRKKAQLDEDLKTMEKNAAELAALEREKELERQAAERQQKEINIILDRGMVHVDMELKQFKFLKDIEFQGIRVSPKMTPAQVPACEFKNPKEAREILSDFAALMKVISKAIVLIEGHTSGSQVAVSPIGFKIAAERAELVVETLKDFGLDEHRLESKGLPGNMGVNEHKVMIKTLSWD